MLSVRSALELFDVARSRGLTFQLVGPQKLRIEGPADTMFELNDEIDAHAAGLVAVAEEFATDSTIVIAAQALLRPGARPRSSADAILQRGDNRNRDRNQVGRT
jgi:hypothetical protein